MWLHSTKDNRYFNLDKCLRCFVDGTNGWAFLQDDGTIIHVADSDMETAKRFLDPANFLGHGDHEDHVGDPNKIDKDAVIKALLQSKE
jgi:hypothetical protein